MSSLDSKCTNEVEMTTSAVVGMRTQTESIDGMTLIRIVERL